VEFDAIAAPALLVTVTTGRQPAGSQRNYQRCRCRTQRRKQLKH